MPALVNSNVGSFAGRRGDERTRLCPCSSKYFRNASRISLPVMTKSSLPHIRIIRAISSQCADLVAHKLECETTSQQMIEEAFCFSAVLRLASDTQTLGNCLINQLLF